jgi:hypothetical protein
MRAHHRSAWPIPLHGAADMIIWILMAVLVLDACYTILGSFIAAASAFCTFLLKR